VVALSTSWPVNLVESCCFSLDDLISQNPHGALVGRHDHGNPIGTFSWESIINLKNTHYHNIVMLATVSIVVANTQLSNWRFLFAGAIAAMFSPIKSGALW